MFYDCVTPSSTELRFMQTWQWRRKWMPLIRLQAIENFGKNKVKAPNKNNPNYRKIFSQITEYK